MADIETLGQVEVFVEYAWKPTMCALCKSLGHMDHAYRSTKRVWRPKQVQKPHSDQANRNANPSFSTENPIVPKVIPVEVPSEEPNDVQTEGTPANSTMLKDVHTMPNDAPPTLGSEGVHSAMPTVTPSAASTTIPKGVQVVVGSPVCGSRHEYSAPKKPIFLLLFRLSVQSFILA